MTKQSNHFYDINLGRRRLIQGAAVLPLAGLGGLAFAQQFPTAKVNTTKLAVTDTEVVVGQLHSASGTMAISETGSIQAERLAIEQILSDVPTLLVKRQGEMHPGHRQRCRRFGRL